LLLECTFETNTHHPVDMLDVSNVYGSRYCRPRVFPVPLSAPRSTSASRSRRAVASETLVSSRYIVFVITPCSLTYCIACCMRRSCSSNKGSSAVILSCHVSVSHSVPLEVEMGAGAVTGALEKVTTNSLISRNCGGGRLVRFGFGLKGGGRMDSDASEHHQPQ